MEEMTKIRDGRCYTLRLFENGTSVVFEQAVNPKTGKGWQKTMNSKTFDGHIKGRWDWTKRGSKRGATK